MELAPQGVSPHDVVRDLLDADLRWRDPEGYREVFRAVRAHAMREVRRTEGRPQQGAIADLKFLFRNLRSVLSPVAWDDWGDHYPDRAVAADRARHHPPRRVRRGWPVRGLCGSLVRPTARGVPRRPRRARLASRGRGRARPHGRQHGGPRRRPGNGGRLGFVERTAPARVGEVVTQCRFTVDAETYQGPSPTLNAVPIVTMQRRADHAAPRVGPRHPRRPGPLERVLRGRRPAPSRGCGLPRRRATLRALRSRLPPGSPGGGDGTVDGTGTGRRCPPASTGGRRPLNRWCCPTGTSTAAVRQAMKDLHRPELLARNPLLRTRLVTTRAAASGARGPGRAPACRGRVPRRRPASRRAPSGAGRDLPPHVPHPGVRRSDPGPAVQHLPPAPPPGTPAGRGLAVGAGAGHRWAEVDTT